MMQPSSLDWEILRLFKRAEMEHRSEVAEHLLQALEATAADTPDLSTPLAETYSELSRSKTESSAGNC